MFGINMEALQAQQSAAMEQQYESQKELMACLNRIAEALEKIVEYLPEKGEE